MTIGFGRSDGERRAYLGISRGTVVKADDKPLMQELEIRNWFGERQTNVEHWTPAGLSHVPLPPKDGKEAEVLVAHLGGSPDHPVVIGTADRRSRPQKLDEGDLVLYDPRDNRRRVHFAKDGSLKISMPKGGKAILDIDGQKLSISKEGWNFEGSGSIKHNGKRIDATHKHGGIQPGGSLTDVPATVLVVAIAADLIVRLVGADEVLRLASAVWSAFA